MQIYIETLGCPKNAVDSECAAGILEKVGHVITEDPGESDAILVNTCAFIQDAKQESIDTILAFGDYTQNAGKILMVSGCLGQRYPQEIFEEIPEVDILTGVNGYEQLPALISRFANDKVRICAEDKTPAVYREMPDRKYAKEEYRGFLRISEGCDNCCSYCVIPSIRGRYRSRRLEDILGEAEKMAAQGCREITVIAQDVTNYGQDIYDEKRLAALLDELCKVNGIKWIRLMYCYSDKIDDALVDVLAKQDKICKYIDMPIQHASDHMLTAMGRKGSKSSIIAAVQLLRQKIPDIHVRTTLITGFPGETREDFEELVEFIKTTQFERLGVFAYSKEEGTPAGRMKGQISQTVKEKRRDRIMALQREISLAQNQCKIGNTMEVLIEEELEEDGLYTGRSQYDAFEIDNAVIVKSGQKLTPGQFVKVVITDAFDYDLVGEVAEPL